MTHQDARRTALVVDFDAWERAFTAKVLLGEGYHVLAASNGASGLRLAQQCPCDVILLDLVLPELPGSEVVEQLRAGVTTRAVPVIVVGGAVDSAPPTVQGYIPRPLDEQQVLHEVGRVLAPIELPTALALASPTRRTRRVVLVASTDDALAGRLARRMQLDGSVACTARSAAGCLRVATAVGPDLVVLDATLPDHLEALLRAHPVSARADIRRLSLLPPAPARLQPGTVATRRAAVWDALRRLRGVLWPAARRPAEPA